MLETVVETWREKCEVEVRVLKRIAAAVRSVLDCTDPEIWYGEIIAKGSRMASPYVSRKTITYMYATDPLPEYSLFAQSWKHAILIGPSVPPIPAFPKRGLVTQWEGGKVPFSVVEPVFRLALEMGLRPWKPESLVYAWVLTPVLWGWHYGAPVFPAATADQNEPLAISGEPDVTQGSMIFVPITDENRVKHEFFLQEWRRAHGTNVRESDFWWFYNHFAMTPESTIAPDASFVTKNFVNPVGVRYCGQRYACLAISGPVVIWAHDHEPVSLPAKEFYALHPLLDD
jgi:hypothetical protein